MRRFAGGHIVWSDFFVVGRVLAGRVNGRMCYRSAEAAEPSKTAFLRPRPAANHTDNHLQTTTPNPFLRGGAFVRRFVGGQIERPDFFVVVMFG